jgi:hypothetical protein
MNFSVENTIEKKDGGRRLIFQNKTALVSNTKMCVDGATVAATPTFRAAGCLVIFQARPAAFPRKHSILQESPIKYHKCPTYDEQNAGDFQFQLN